VVFKIVRIADGECDDSKLVGIDEFTTVGDSVDVPSSALPSAFSSLLVDPEGSKLVGIDELIMSSSATILSSLLADPEDSKLVGVDEFIIVGENVDVPSCTSSASSTLASSLADTEDEFIIVGNSVDVPEEVERIVGLGEDSNLVGIDEFIIVGDNVDVPSCMSSA